MMKEKKKLNKFVRIDKIKNKLVNMHSLQICWKIWYERCINPSLHLKQINDYNENENSLFFSFNNSQYALKDVLTMNIQMCTHSNLKPDKLYLFLSFNENLRSPRRNGPKFDDVLGNISINYQSAFVWCLITWYYLY